MPCAGIGGKSGERVDARLPGVFANVTSIRSHVNRKISDISKISLSNEKMSTEKIKGKSRDTRDRLTFDVGELRERLRAQAIEPGQSLASIVRMALIEWLEQREAMEDKKSEKSD